MIQYIDTQKIKNYLFVTEVATLWKRLLLHLFVLFCTTYLFGMFLLSGLDTLIERFYWQSIKPAAMVLFLISAYSFTVLPMFFSCRLVYFGKPLSKALSGLILVGLILLLPVYWMVLLAIALGTVLDLNRMS